MILNANMRQKTIERKIWTQKSLSKVRVEFKNADKTIQENLAHLFF